VKITGENFGPIFLRISNGAVTEADRPVSYMRGWPVARVFKLAERWGWKVDVYAEERAQLERPPEPAT